MRHAARNGWVCVACVAAAWAAAAADGDAPGAEQGATVPAESAEPLEEIVVRAPEPRYVAPTRRDQIGRIWAPVYINEKGPFRLVLDTGATRSGVVATVAAALGLMPDANAQVMIQGVTGAAPVSTIKVSSLIVGDVQMNGSRLPILADALGGAEGILGTEGLADRRVFIDFRNDLIIISRSHSQGAPPHFVTVPFRLEHGRMVAEVSVGLVRAKAIIDTGGQSSVANLALRNALRRRVSAHPQMDDIQGVTQDVEQGEWLAAPPIGFGPIEIRTGHLSFADLSIFRHWRLTSEPAMLIGMDALGLLDTLIIDYRRQELQLLLAHG